MNIRLPLLLSACLACAVAAFSGTVPEPFVRAVRRAFDADASWTMEKELPAVRAPLRSSGTVSCRIGRGFVWRTERPFAQEIRIAPEAMTFVSEAGTEVKPCDTLPYYSDIRRATDAFLAGDTGIFGELFDWTWDETPDGRWTMRLETRSSRMARLFETVELSGGETLERAVMKTPANGTLRIGFEERPRTPRETPAP